MCVWCPSVLWSKDGRDLEGQNNPLGDVWLLLQTEGLQNRVGCLSLLSSGSWGDLSLSVTCLLVPFLYASRLSCWTVEFFSLLSALEVSYRAGPSGALGRERQEVQEFKASLGCVVWSLPGLPHQVKLVLSPHQLSRELLHIWFSWTLQSSLFPIIPG